MKKLGPILFTLLFVGGTNLSAADGDKNFLDAKSKYYTFTKVNYPFVSESSGVSLSLFNGKVDVLEISKNENGSYTMVYQAKKKELPIPDKFSYFFYTSRVIEPLVVKYHQNKFEELSIGKKTYVFKDMKQFKFGDHEILLLTQDTEAMVLLDRKEIIKKENTDYGIHNLINWLVDNYLRTHSTEKLETIESIIKQVVSLDVTKLKSDNGKARDLDLSFLNSYVVKEPKSRFGLPEYKSLTELAEGDPRFLSTDERNYGSNKSLGTLSLVVGGKKLIEGDFGLLFSDEKDWMAASVIDDQIAIKGSKFEEKIADERNGSIIIGSTNLVPNLTFVNGKTYVNKLNGFLLGNRDDLKYGDPMRSLSSINHVNIAGSVATLAEQVPPPLVTAKDPPDVSKFLWYLPKQGADFEFMSFSTDPYDLQSSLITYTLLFPDGSGIRFSPERGLYVPGEDAYYFLIKSNGWSSEPDQLIKVKLSK